MASINNVTALGSLTIDALVSAAAYTFTSHNNPTNGTVSSVEETVLKSLAANFNENIGQIINTNHTTSVDDMTNVFKAQLYHSNDNQQGNIAMALALNGGVSPLYPNNKYNESSNITHSLAKPNLSNDVKLSDDSSALYNANVKAEYSDGDSRYVSPAGDHLSFDTLDADYNLHKAVNSSKSNTAPNSDEGHILGYDNNFNQTTAFLTSNILNRNSNNNQLSLSGTNLGLDAINASSDVNDEAKWNMLHAQVAFSAAPSLIAMFGSYKFVQPHLTVEVDTNVSDTSTLSALNNDEDAALVTTPSTTLSESDFKNLFTLHELSTVGPGYSFDIEIHKKSSDGYSLDTDSNNVDLPIYNANNDITNYTSELMFEVDDSAILENHKYMKFMKEHNLFNNNSHKLQVKNGTLEKNPTHSSNKNYPYFDVTDGVESLTASNNTDIGDLTVSGLISVLNSNNDLGSPTCRYTKYRDNLAYNTPSAVNSLVVTYNAEEPEYEPSSGTLTDMFKVNHYVSTDITTLLHSTKSGMYDKWSPTVNDTHNAATAHDTVLLFKNDNNMSNFSSNNISDFQAVGLNELVTHGQSAFFTVDNKFNFEDSDEGPLFKTMDNKTKQGVTSNISITNIDLNDIGIEDIRVKFICKKLLDIPQPTNGWAWITGDDQTGHFANFDDSLNDNNLISSKDGNDILGFKVYDIFNGDRTLPIQLDIKLLTDAESRPNKDYLSRYINFSVKHNNSTIIDKHIDMDDHDVKMDIMSETTSQGEVQDLIGLNLPSYYVVKKYITTKVFRVAIRSRVGPYTNLWAKSSLIEEKTHWYQLTNSNKNDLIMPDYYLIKILYNGAQKFQASRTFNVVGGQSTSVISTSVILTVSDLMGLKSKVEYFNSLSQTWNQFTLGPYNADSVDAMYDSVDAMYDSCTKFKIMKPDNNNTMYGIMSITLDAEMGTVLGSNTDISTVDNNDHAIYMINLSMSRGKNSLDIKGHLYDNARDSTYFNKNKTWSPYSDNEGVFLKDNNNNLMGTEIRNLNTIVELIDPTPGNTDNVNEVNKIKLIVKQGTSTLFSFVSDKYILNNFNVINSKHTIVQNDYYVGKRSYSDNVPVAIGTEYLSSDVVSSEREFVKLYFGTSSTTGIRVELTSLGTGDRHNRLHNSLFKLNSDQVQMSPITETVNVENRYNGLYSNTYEYIQPSISGFPLPTNSTKHRNIKVNIFRGLHNGEPPIEIVRTMTTVKLVIGNKFMDDLNVVSNTNIASVWANRNTFNGNDARLMSKALIKGNFELPELENMNIVSSVLGDDIGGIGLVFNPKYSMFSKAIGPLHKINIELNPSTYLKKIVNPLNPSLNQTVNSNLFDYELHKFKDFSFIATRIKVYEPEIYKFNYVMSDLQVFHNPSYIGDPRSFGSWNLINTYTDSQLRNGVRPGDGVLSFKKLQTFASSFTKYCISARPIAYLEAYNVSQLLAALPDNYQARAYDKNRWYFDINIDKFNGLPGEPPSTQIHKPFNKSPSSSDPNPYAPVHHALGVNNVTVGVNISNYLHLKEQTFPSVSFTMKSNKLKISMGVGLTAHVGNNYTQIFYDYIEHLDKPASWHSELSGDLSNNFGLDKKWTLNFKNLLGPIQSFLSLSPNSLTDKCIKIHGITHYGMGTYTLDLRVLDSLKMMYYLFNLHYDSINDIHKAKFSRYSTSSISPIGWSDTHDFAAASEFSPQMYTKEDCEVIIEMHNTLTDIPYNVDTYIKDYINLVKFQELTWIVDSNFIPKKSDIMFHALSTKGAGALLELLQVTNEHPYKLLLIKRPAILDIRRLDGSRIFGINYDGHVLSTTLSTRRLSLTNKPSNTNIKPTFLNKALYQQNNMDYDDVMLWWPPMPPPPP